MSRLLVSKNLIYALCHPVTEEIRYIGKSEDWLNPPRRHGKKSYMAEEKYARLPVVKWIAKLHSENIDYVIKIIEEFPKDLPSSSLCEREKYWIAIHGGPCWNPESRLLNCTDGGEGASGVKRTEAQKEHLRKLFTGKTMPEDVIKNMKDAWNRPGMKEAARDRSLGNTYSNGKKKPWSEERKKAWTGRKGVPWSEERKRVVAENPRHFNHTEATKKVMSQKAKNRVFSSEERRRLQEASVRARQRPVADSDGNEFPSIKKAAEFHGVTAQGVKEALTDNRLMRKIGKTFRYLPRPE